MWKRYAMVFFLLMAPVGLVGTSVLVGCSPSTSSEKAEEHNHNHDGGDHNHDMNHSDENHGDK
jgi:hypothetical protein